MSGGGKGGKTTTGTEIPQWLSQPAQENIQRAQQVQQMGYMPYYGPDVAAFTPMQQTAMQSTMDTAAAFGLAPQGQNAMAGMPQAQDHNGMMAHSSGGLFDQALAELQSRRPGQMDAYNAMHINPQTGAQPNQYNPLSLGSQDWMRG